MSASGSGGSVTKHHCVRRCFRDGRRDLAINVGVSAGMPPKQPH
jgi:hypothetical protein